MGKRAGSMPRRSSLTPSAAVGLEPGEDRRGDRVAGGELVGEALAGGVEQGRALAAHRLGDQQRRRAGSRAAASAVGWNWQNSRSARSAPAAAASTGPAPIAPQGLVVRRQSAAAPPVASTVAARGDRAAVGDHAVAALAVAPERQRRGPLADLDPRLGVDHRRQLRGDLVAGLAAAGVDDAAARMASLEAERQPSLVVEVEDDAARLQLADRRRRLVDQHLDRRGAAEAAAGGDRVGGVAVGRVVGLERRGEPALRPVAGALGERRAGDQADPAALLGGPQRRPQPGGAAADDDDVELGGCRYLPAASRRIVLTCSRSQAAAASRARASASAIFASASAARRSASLTRCSAASAWASISASRSSAAAIACSFASRSVRSARRSWSSRSGSSASAVFSFSFSRSASRARISAVARFSAARRIRPPRGGAAAPLRSARSGVASRIGPLVAHRRTNLLRGGENVAVGLDRALRRPRRRRATRPARRRRSGGRRSRGGGERRPPRRRARRGRRGRRRCPRGGRARCRPGSRGPAPRRRAPRCRPSRGPRSRR